MTSRLPAAVTRTRPEAVDLDSEWSAVLLRTILDDPRPARPRHRTRRIIAAAAAAVLLTGGAAYTAGFVPGFVRDGFSDVSKTDVIHQRPSLISMCQTAGASASGSPRTAQGNCVRPSSRTGTVRSRAWGRRTRAVTAMSSRPTSPGRRKRPVPGAQPSDPTLYLHGERPDQSVTKVQAMATTSGSP